jgi:hypothetical protein
MFTQQYIIYNPLANWDNKIRRCALRQFRQIHCDQLSLSTVLRTKVASFLKPYQFLAAGCRDGDLVILERGGVRWGGEVGDIIVTRAANAAESPATAAASAAMRAGAGARAATPATATAERPAVDPATPTAATIVTMAANAAESPATAAASAAMRAGA